MGNVGYAIFMLLPYAVVTVQFSWATIDMWLIQC